MFADGHCYETVGNQTLLCAVGGNAKCFKACGGESDSIYQSDIRIYTLANDPAPGNESQRHTRELFVTALFVTVKDWK